MTLLSTAGSLVKKRKKNVTLGMNMQKRVVLADARAAALLALASAAVVLADARAAALLARASNVVVLADARAAA